MPKTALRFPSLRAIGAIAVAIGVVGAATAAQAGGNRFLAITKGAVDGMLDLATHVWREGQVLPMTADERTAIETANNGMAQNGMRVLAP